MTGNIDMNQMIQDALREATTRVGKLDPHQMQLMGHTLNAAAGVYGNQLTAENQKGILDLQQQAQDLMKKNSLNLNAPSGIMGASNGGIDFTPSTPNAPSPVMTQSDPIQSRMQKGSTISISDINSAIDRIMGKR